jgi:hypothetical protein
MTDKATWIMLQIARILAIAGLILGPFSLLWNLVGSAALQIPLQEPAGEIVIRHLVKLGSFLAASGVLVFLAGNRKTRKNGL